MQMNRCGREAMSHWQRWRPIEYATLSNPEAYFSTLGNQVTEQIDLVRDQLLSQQSALSTSSAEKIAAWQTATSAATEMVTLDLVYLTPEPGTQDQEPETWTSMQVDQEWPSEDYEDWRSVSD